MSAANESAKILVVDDDPLVRKLVRRGLEAGGFETLVEAHDGASAQAALAAGDIDLVITDLRMPGMDGLDLMRWATEHAPGAGWIIISAVEAFDAAVEAIRLGAFEFLTKPVHTRQLVVAVRNALGARRLQREKDRLFTELEASNRTLLEKVGELEEKSEVIRRDLQRAEMIQRALLPKQPPRLEGLCLQTFYRPSRYVGGDVYNVVRLTDRHVALYVADATGHGVSSAMLSVLFDRKLVLAEEDEQQPHSPARVLADVNRAICGERIAPGLFLTAAYCLIDTSSHECVIALAGHPPALLRRADGELLAFPRTGPALGLTPGASYDEERFELGSGDRLLLYTDGVLDGAQAGVAARTWLGTVLARDDQESRDVVDLLGSSATAGSTEDERDDVTVLLLGAEPGASRFDHGESAGTGGVHGAGGPSGKQPVVFYGESAKGSFFAIRGRGTWLHSDILYEAVASILDEGRAVTIDLGECEYLDSTFLGTIHELVERSRSGRGTLRLQRITAPVRELFDELSMTRVLAALSEDAAFLPPDMQPLLPVSDPAGSQWRVLRAHETLAALSPKNREKFHAVVDTIRSNLDR
jgi:serine phosphatase RsbU (regulator of sigma subunit)/anti-anti-sigma regulatory factor